MQSKFKNLLIVEDNKFIGSSIVNAIKNNIDFINLQLTTTLQEAISLVFSKDFNLITLDLSLPDGNGLELLKMLKENNNVDRKVLVFSTNTHLKRVCLKYGAYAFFDKAKDFEKLIDTIKTVN